MLRCRHCGEVIGVYEPLIRVSAETVIESSRAGDPELADHGGEHYHRACYERSREPQRSARDAAMPRSVVSPLNNGGLLRLAAAPARISLKA